MASNQNKGRIPEIVNPGGNPKTPNYWASKKAMMGIGIVLMSRGLPMLLQGQAMLTYAPFLFPTPPAIDWTLTQYNGGMVHEVVDMISLRRNLGGVSKGMLGTNMKVLMVVDTSTQKILAFTRSDGTNSALIIINMYETSHANYKISNIPSDGVWHQRFNGDNAKYSALYGNFGVDQPQVQVSNGAGLFHIPKYSMLIFTM
eukprot:TRINITY_DN2177_c0_g1_i2.p1 TRINITY_DN2177_c0_g1~~TRINITY_DN2177_c0_g1_i2.p1  ORF type:complete len:201 (+),score=23.10 TRINITY_DN2177_c0_g1_i2:699-1301(+)